MAKMKVKLDARQAKQYMVEKGERVALVVAGVIMVLFVGWGVVLALGAHSPHEDLRKQAEQGNQKIDAAPSDEAKRKYSNGPVETADWRVGEVTGDEYAARTMFDAQETRDSKRTEPRILPMDTLVRQEGTSKDVRQIHVQYVRGGVVTYDIRGETIATHGKGGAVGVGVGPEVVTVPLVRTIRPTKMIVVTATFPYREQAEIYRKALKFEKIEDLFPRDAPDFRGFNVMKRTVLADGKATDWKPLYIYDPKLDKTIVHNNTSIDEVMKAAIFDEDNIAYYNEYLYRNGAAPLPALESGEYPRIELTGINVKGDIRIGGGRKKRPGMVGVDPLKEAFGKPPIVPPEGEKGGDDPDANLKLAYQQMKKVLPKWMLERILDPNYFDPFGTRSPEDKLKTLPVGPKEIIAPPVREETPGDVPMGTYRTGRVPTALPTGDKCMVRFVDVLDPKEEARPGATYEYLVQVRMANPNFGRPKEVSYSALADPKELVSPWVITPPVTVPSDFQYYVIDQLHFGKLENQLKGENAIDMKPYYNPNEKAPIQIHAWLGKFKDQGVDRYVSDWVIAERLLFQRGEEIARREVHVEVPIWVVMRGRFELGNRGGKVKAKGPLGRTGVAVDFAPEPRRAPDVLVDFDGGKKPYGRNSIADETALELLILTNDGKLIVRNSRDDCYDAGWKGQEEPESIQHREARERRTRYETWRERLRDYRETPMPVIPKGGPGG